ncbi:radical SAM protein [Desulfovibrio sulfodismutans]|uniref:Radical SAM protein n=1 Tax=Desulfolutivibrio sulfodismutans TaxID=63561 RepID=A0A7K3NRJ3_9BACT|nr:radical SAM/SPASM domain-containing protein [Desulfolutivibrio sulfodismutans]NDY58443.1 radical SAM protein [Desulfolutivibrio sulfodismutans]QLA14121.1 radical SAM protein [Desulfolutivibrio sulfodismutans DSM 3696]
MGHTEADGMSDAAAGITLVNLEFNSSCNLRCRHCSLDHRKKRRIMEPATLSRVMGLLAAGQLPNLRRLDLHNGGETLLHPDLPGMLAIIAAFRQRLGAGAVVGLLTNAMLLTPEISRHILASRAVDQLRVSLDGGSPERFEHMRRGAKWDTVAKNVAAFMRLNAKHGHPVRTEAICVMPPQLLPDGPFAPQFVALAQTFDKVSLRPPHNWDGSRELGIDDASYRATAASRSGEACFLLSRNLVVLPDGSVTVCCNDLNARGVFGSILTEDFRALAGHPARQDWLGLFREGRQGEIELCRNCSGFFAPPGRGEEA